MNAFNVKHVSEVLELRDEIVKNVRQNGYAVLRGLFDRDEIGASTRAVYRHANSATHRASSGVAPADIRENMTKWSIGGNSTTQTGLPRFMLTVYNPLWQADEWGLRGTFERVIAIRDSLADRDVQTDESLAPDRYNGCRVQIYPSGGGFMGSHVDSRAVSNLAPEKRETYIQMVLLMTERGTDYQHGGAFVTLNGEVIDSEANAKLGDVLVYDGNTDHGVADIDPSVSFDAKDLRGRAVALATVYTR
jgi:hypothetical protein